MKRYLLHILTSPITTMASMMFLLASCQSFGEREIARARRDDTCGARALRPFIGRKADQPTRSAIERSVVDKRRIRWIVIGEDILADLQTSRVNVVLAEDSTIMSVACY
ncbi:hypothetical protein NDN01_06690 [Sphingomonas sp. QA11]|uniref:hypothetical protein n=1 Tax=Sphingomonas sp. QA11 TaxID=2950605 RepID=UPI00234BD1DC|nr:hypothetical protein [Sphingomonas sp. QA11]WCM28604.1 hypothetical protein NDN01_06690 [Sphingomonas sp. QA11]